MMTTNLFVIANVNQSYLSGLQYLIALHITAYCSVSCWFCLLICYCLSFIFGNSTESWYEVVGRVVRTADTLQAARLCARNTATCSEVFSIQSTHRTIAMLLPSSLNSSHGSEVSEIRMGKSNKAERISLQLVIHVTSTHQSPLSPEHDSSRRTTFCASLLQGSLNFQLEYLTVSICSYDIHKSHFHLSTLIR
jgi:hypothetical protein